MILRFAQAKALKTFKDFPALALLGPRQVGKTTLAKELVKHLPKSKPSLYLDLESPFDLAKLREPELFLTEHQDYCVIIDEIQHKPELFSLMRSLIDKKRIPCRFIVTGSVSLSIIKNVSDSLAGRIFYLNMSGFNYLEIKDKVTLEKLWFNGGFPGMATAKSLARCKAWADNFIQTYIQRDLPQLGLSLTPQMIYRFWYMLAHYHGGIWNASSFANALSVSSVTISKYLDYMEGAFLVNRLMPYTFDSHKRVVKSPKIYIRDSGILHRMHQITDIKQLKSTALVGHSWEGFVIEQIRQLAETDFGLFYYRTHAGAECDLVLTKGLRPVAIVEIKYSSQPSVNRGLMECITDLKSKNNFIVIPMHDADFKTSNGIIVCGLPVFLTKYLKKL